MKVAIIHYHLEPSGVSRVIERASRKLTQRGIAHVILVGKCPHDLADTLPVRVVDGIAYSDAPLEKADAEKILDALHAATTDALGTPPDVWHFHNHSLGKNRAIPLIVSMLASQRERLLLHIHDLAEDGRPENRANIADCPNLYPLAPQIHYAFINSRDRNHFIKAGLSATNAHLLPNPVFDADSIPRLTSETPNTAPLLLCPARGIRRKNIGELILLTQLAPTGTRTAITLAPENPQWLAIHDRWKHFCAANHLPVDFAVVDRIAPTTSSDASFESWISHATHFVTCSISEGFGLVFLESLAYGKPLIGRKLPHISNDLAKHGVEHTKLYEKILIPADWISYESLKRHLESSLTRLWQAWNRKPTADAIESTITSIECDGFWDFGNLPEVLQERVIRKLLDPIHHAAPRVLIDGEIFPLKPWIDDVLIHNQQLQTQQFFEGYSTTAHGERLAGILNLILDQETSTAGALMPDRILEAHLAVSEFHFLKSPAALRLHSIDTSPLRAAIFDVYGTMLDAPAGGVKPDPDADSGLREIIKAYGYKPPGSPSHALHAAIRQHHQHSAEEFPEVDLCELWREILEAPEDCDLKDLIISLETFWHPSRIMPGLEHFLKELHDSGIVLGILSNAQINTLPSLGHLANLFEPDLIILSYQHRISKPSPALFSQLATRLKARGIAPKNALYIGNDPNHDIIPAHQQGFQTAFFTTHALADANPFNANAHNHYPSYKLVGWHQS
jgi:FMN phosphatase YigB (HAD superfamily)/glycosyltransferase involved in cell wall biosynthesis